jgi:hypothetical protein
VIKNQLLWVVETKKAAQRAALKSRIRYILTLTRFKARLSFINNIYTTLATNDATIAVARFKRAK